MPYIPHILEHHRRKEYVPAVAADRIRPLPEEARQPPVLEGELGRKDSIIDVLIVAKKGEETVRALQYIRHRLRRSSTIVLLHNGMGVLPQVQAMWPENLRPNILEGFSTHGLSKRDDFTVDHWGKGAIHMAIAPRLDERDIFSYRSLSEELSPIINIQHVHHDIRLAPLTTNPKHASLLFTIQQLLHLEPLNCTLRAYIPDLYLIQLRRTLLQSIIQILGTLQRCTNGEIVQNKRNHKIMGRLIDEMLPAIHSDPLIQSSPLYQQRFSFHELYRQLYKMAIATPNHMNALVQDIIGKRETEIPTHTAYLLGFARERGVKVPTWRLFHQLVLAARRLEFMRYEKFVPVAEDGELKDMPEWMDESSRWDSDAFEAYKSIGKERYAFDELEEVEFDPVDAEEPQNENETQEKEKVEEQENAAKENVNKDILKDITSPTRAAQSSLVARLQIAAQYEAAASEGERQRELLSVPNRADRSYLYDTSDRSRGKSTSTRSQTSKAFRRQLPKGKSAGSTKSDGSVRGRSIKGA